VIEVSLRRLNEVIFQLGEGKAIERELGKQREKATQFTSDTGKKAVKVREKKKRGTSAEGSRSEPKERSRGTAQRIAKKD
jgi:hypothetical protein